MVALILYLLGSFFMYDQMHDNPDNGVWISLAYAAGWPVVLVLYIVLHKLLGID